MNISTAMHPALQCTHNHGAKFVRTAIKSPILRIYPRTFSTASRLAIDRSSISPSANSDPETLLAETTALVDHGYWTLTNKGKALERTFKLKSFNVTWDFMNTIASECKKQKHHPEWTNIYNRTRIRWTTHRPEGLSERDTAMARFCDRVAREMGEVRAGEERTGDALESGLELGAGDCCGVGAGKKGP